MRVVILNTDSQGTDRSWVGDLPAAPRVGERLSVTFDGTSEVSAWCVDHVTWSFDKYNGQRYFRGLLLSVSQVEGEGR